ncbi:DUF72 domain-containing protein [Flavobacteriaceae bacterium Ap0902]|nr:DUF72 domain-containing protein [Flavobacteriaceae bacterium Ap0902]
MKFGKIDVLNGIDFSLPPDHPETANILKQNASGDSLPDVYVGCAKWNKQDLKNFYPRGTKDELAYYATQFNAIEMNAGFYRIFPKEQFEKWAYKVTPGFKFFPKIYQGISHWKRLQNAENYVEENINAILRLEAHLGMPFIQMHQNFSPKPENVETLENFIQNVWPAKFPLAFELRHEDWFNNPPLTDEVFNLFEKNQITNIITDTAGRRDMLHMRLTTRAAFIRYVGSNDKILDYKRAEKWTQRIKQWSDLGIQKVFFFVHQHKEEESVAIAKFFIEKLNDVLGTELKVPLLKEDTPKLDL